MGGQCVWDLPAFMGLPPVQSLLSGTLSLLFLLPSPPTPLQLLATWELSVNCELRSETFWPHCEC